MAKLSIKRVKLLNGLKPLPEGYRELEGKEEGPHYAQFYIRKMKVDGTYDLELISHKSFSNTVDNGLGNSAGGNWFSEYIADCETDTLYEILKNQTGGVFKLLLSGYVKGEQNYHSGDYDTWLKIKGIQLYKLSKEEAKYAESLD